MIQPIKNPGAILSGRELATFTGEVAGSCASCYYTEGTEANTSHRYLDAAWEAMILGKVLPCLKCSKQCAGQKLATTKWKQESERVRFIPKDSTLQGA